MTSESTRPLITIGIPTYNRPEGLANTLLKATSQTYKNLEIIVSDNASIDEASYREVIESFSHDKRIKYIRQKENLGSLGNFPFLTEVATGEYFLWMSDDDDVELNYIEELYLAMESETNFSIIFGGYDIEDMMSEPVIRTNLTKHHANLRHDSTYERMKSYIEQPDHLGKSRLNWGLFPIALIRRAFKECQTHIDSTQQPIWGDFPIDFRLLSYGNVKVVDKVLWHVKLLPTSDGKSQLTGAFSKLAMISRRTEKALIATINDSNLSKAQKKTLIGLVKKKSKKEKIQLFLYYKVIGQWSWGARKVKELYYLLFA